MLLCFRDQPSRTTHPDNPGANTHPPDRGAERGYLCPDRCEPAAPRLPQPPAPSIRRLFRRSRRPPHRQPHHAHPCTRTPCRNTREHPNHPLQTLIRSAAPRSAHHPTHHPSAQSHLPHPPPKPGWRNAARHRPITQPHHPNAQKSSKTLFCPLTLPRLIRYDIAIIKPAHPARSAPNLSQNIV